MSAMPIVRKLCGPLVVGFALVVILASAQKGPPRAGLPDYSLAKITNAQGTWSHGQPYQFTIDFSGLAARDIQTAISQFESAYVRFTFTVQVGTTAVPAGDYRSTWMLAKATPNPATNNTIDVTVIAQCPHFAWHQAPPGQRGLHPGGTGKGPVILNINNFAVNTTTGATIQGSVGQVASPTTVTPQIYALPILAPNTGTPVLSIPTEQY